MVIRCAGTLLNAHPERVSCSLSRLPFPLPLVASTVTSSALEKRRTSACRSGIMPRRDSGESDLKGTDKTRKQRCKSASEISRNVKSFETWATYQGCEEVAFDDIPKAFKAEVKDVFDVNAQLPREWLDKKSNAYSGIESILPLEFIQFLQAIGKATPELFSPRVRAADCKELLSDLQNVFSAWTRIKKMRESSRIWSEADYVANVYDVIRSPAVHQSDYRAQCTISLPQPLPHLTITTQSVRVLNAKTASPDCALFTPARLIQHLSHDARSAYKVLKAHGSMASSGSVGGESSFRFQSTPCTKLPENPSFEFASTFWEDKKPVHHLLEDAYRQNRMATTSAVRQLHALHVNAPIFGLVWAQGTVRAHVDWWTVKANASYPTIQSAAYPGPRPINRRTSGIFHEWNLHNPSDIMQVYLYVRNLDRWTVTGFRDRVDAGVTQLVMDVVHDGQSIVPWRRKGDISRMVKGDRDGDTPVASSITPVNSPPKRKVRRRVHKS